MRKQKLVEDQEDKEHIGNLQAQELAKVKHLVLLREQELDEKASALKEATQQNEKMKSEMSRYRRQEEQLSDLQVIHSLSDNAFYIMHCYLFHVFLFYQCGLK